MEAQFSYGQLSENTYRKAVKSLRHRNGLQLIFFLTIIMPLGGIFTALASSVSRQLLAAVAAALICMMAAWGICQIASGVKNSYWKFLPQVIGELYYGCDFIRIGNRNDIRKYLPHVVTERTHGVNEYWGSLAICTDRGEALIHSLVGSTGNSEDVTYWPHLVYEIPFPADFLGEDAGFLEISCRETDSPVPKLFLRFFHKMEKYSPSKENIENTPLCYRTDRPETAKRILQPQLIQNLLQYYRESSSKDTMVLTQNKLFIITDESTLALEHRKWRRYSPDLFTENAFGVCRRFRLGMKLLE